MGSTMKGERGMKRHDDQERLYETRRHLVIALDYDRRTWIWDLPPSRSEPTHEELTHIVPAPRSRRGRPPRPERVARSVPGGAGRMDDQDGQGHAGGQAAMHRTRVAGRGGPCRTDIGSARSRHGHSRHRQVHRSGRTARGMVPLFRQSASDPDVELPRTRPHAVSDVQALCFRQNGQVFVRSPIQARRNTR